MFNQDYERRLSQKNGIERSLEYPRELRKADGSVTPTKIPSVSPCKFTKQISDRFLPRRIHNNWQVKFEMTSDGYGESHIDETGKNANENSGEPNGKTYVTLLKNELLGENIFNVNDERGDSKALNCFDKRNIFQYGNSLENIENNNEATSPTFSLSPISAKSQKVLMFPTKTTRKISRIPFKILDAPELQDDFYLNLLDWSSSNIISVGLGSKVYLWSASTSQVTKLCDLSEDGNSVTSVAWNERGNLLSVGTHHGHVQIWDAVVNKLVNVFQRHSARVGVLSWNGDVISSGSRDRTILVQDVRKSSVVPVRKFVGHRQEVCGLKWSPDRRYLASGGNDNRLLVWSLHSSIPVQTYTKHLAAVKALAWSPHHHGLLASGGGTADRSIRFWNTLTGHHIHFVDTGSQVCNLMWSKHSDELVSTHGFSQNQILIWKYPSLTQIASLTGHSYRVLYLAMSPDGECMVTGAGDETLRFWNVFKKSQSQKEGKSELNLFTSIR